MNLKNRTAPLTAFLLLIFIIAGLFIVSINLFPHIVDASSDSSHLNIYNERVQPVYPGAVLFSWETDKPATSKVMYGVTFNKGATTTINYGYKYSVKEVETLVTKHSMLITGLFQGISYSFRPISMKENGFEGVGAEKTITLTSSCTYLKNYLKMGEDNDPEDVKKLQTFLRDFEGFSELVVTGIFDQATFDAVSVFQVRYKEDILAPWGIDIPTGYVYYTTQKKINELYCGGEFLLNQDQLTEIDNFYNSVVGLPKGSTLEGIDFGSVGMKNKNSQNVSFESSNEEDDVSDEGVEDGEQSIKKGLLASVFSVAKNSTSAVLNSLRNFFWKNKVQGQEEDLDLEEDGESEDSEEIDTD